MEVAPDVLLVEDTCNVYVLRSGREAVLVDFGSGLVLDRLADLGVDRVTDVLVTHHHRDQVQGPPRAAPRSGCPPRPPAPAARSTTIRPPPGPLLAARGGAGDRHGRRVPHPPPRGLRRLHAPHARAHD